MDEVTRKAITDYYEWHGDKVQRIMREVADPFMCKARLVRFKSKGKEMSSLVMLYQVRTGETVATEMYVVPREHENEMVDSYNKGDYEEEEEGEYDE